MKTVSYENIKLLAADLAGRPRNKLPASEATMLRAFFASELPDLWQREAWPELCDHLEAVELDAEYCFSLREQEEVAVLGSGVYEEISPGFPIAFFELVAGEQYRYVAGNSTKLAHNVIGNDAIPEGLFTAEGTQYVVLGPVGEEVTAQIFTTNEMGDILAVLVGGDPRVTTAVDRLRKDQYTRLDDRVNVQSLTSTAGAIWVDWQTPCPDLLDDTLTATLDDYELPARFKLPLAMRGAALLLSEEDPVRAATLRSAADSELAKQAQRISVPWWRR